MSAKNDLVSRKREELLKKGYGPNIVEVTLDWAVGCAEGMAKYSMADEDFEATVVKFLPRYLKDCDQYIKAMAG